MGLVKSIIQIIMMVIAIACIVGYAAKNIIYYGNGKKMNQKQKKTVIIAKLFLALVLVCMAFVLNVYYSTGSQKENIIIILLAGIYFAEQLDFLLNVED